jgi:PiT family inorganic phosphate transporter
MVLSDVNAFLIVIIAVALVFEFTNGFQDTANAIATSIYTRVLTPRMAILMAAGMNFLGALVSHNVASTITKGLVGIEIAEYVVLAALIAAIFWNIFTWWFAMPSSCSHALIGGLVGAAMAYAMSTDAIHWSGVIQKVIIPIFASPILGFLGGFVIMRFVYFLCRNASRSTANGIFGKLQIFSAAFMAYAHGNNDAQKTMGIITLALISGGILDADALVPIEIKVICAITMACGTAAGGYKIIKTVGRNVTHLQPPGGFSAESAAAGVIEFMTFLGAPVSTTHTITSAVMGVGSAKRLSAVKWGKAREIVIVWIVTLPICVGIGALCCLILGYFF